MKIIKPYAIYFIALITFSFSSCRDHLKKGFYIDNRIPADIRTKFHEQNTLFFKLVKAEDFRALRLIESKELMSGKGIDVRRFDRIKNAINKDNYSLFREYYAVNKWRDSDTIPPLGLGENDFGLQYTGFAKEMYFSMYLPKSGDNKRMITLVYANFDYGWKLLSAEILPYTVNGKTAPQLYELSKQQKDKGNLVNALTTMDIANSCMQPNSRWVYTHDSAMSKYYDTLNMEVAQKCKFPIKAVGLPVEIFKVYGQRIIDSGTYPTICYTTKIKITDSVAVKKENMLLRKQIAKLVPGINQNNKYLIYAAYNKTPTEQIFQDHFDMTEKLP